jgi:S-DNA-T family DNA segregation ATPase FtsK/SpoIIIE
MRLGYTRAARIIDMMEQEGLIGPFEGSKPRRILVDRTQWIEKPAVAQEENA